MTSVTEETVETVDVSAMTDDELAEHLADLHRQWRPLKMVQPAPMAAGRSINPIPWARKCALGAQISQAEIESATRRQRVAEVELQAVREAIDSQGDEMTVA